MQHEWCFLTEDYDHDTATTHHQLARPLPSAEKVISWKLCEKTKQHGTKERRETVRSVISPSNEGTRINCICISDM